MPTFYVNHDAFDGCICLTQSEFAEMFAAGLRLLNANVTNTPVWLPLNDGQKSRRQQQAADNPQRHSPPPDSLGAARGTRRLAPPGLPMLQTSRSKPLTTKTVAKATW